MRARVHVFLRGRDKMRLRGFVEGIEVMRECFVDELRGKDKRGFYGVNIIKRSWDEGYHIGATYIIYLRNSLREAF